MKDYKEYYNTIMNSSKASGDKPKIRDYIFIKISDNFPIVTLLFLTIIFATIGIFTAIYNFLDLSNWFLDAAKLCLGVFLGLFAAKRVK